MDDPAFYGITIRTARKPFDFDISEAVIDEPRFPNLHVTSFQRVFVRNQRAAEVGEIKSPIGLERFSMAERNLHSGFPGDLQPAPANDVLAEIENEFPRHR